MARHLRIFGAGQFPNNVWFRFDCTVNETFRCMNDDSNITYGKGLILQFRSASAAFSAM